MHDPMTVAHEIKYPWRAYSSKQIEERAAARGVPIDHPSIDFERGYRRTFITIWHVDPETDGSDDSCGWFVRARHVDQAVREQIIKDFTFEWSHGYPHPWFTGGKPNYSTHAIVLMMFQRAAHTAFSHDWRKTRDFMRRYVADILLFAENATDSLYTLVNRRYSDEKEDEVIRNAADCVYTWIMRAVRPWYRHPKWHVHHWEIQCTPLLDLKRWLFSRCATCGHGFKWGYAPTTSQWNGTGPRWFRGEQDVHHSDCSAPDVDTTAKVSA